MFQEEYQALTTKKPLDILVELDGPQKPLKSEFFKMNLNDKYKKYMQQPNSESKCKLINITILHSWSEMSPSKTIRNRG
jgi:hypothetical protein